MSPKSKHGRGKHHRSRKKSKFRKMQAVAGVTQQVAPGNITQAEAPSSVPPAVKTKAPVKASTTAALPLHYEFIGGDLKRIGILTGIVVILLIAAYYIFS